MDFMDCLVDANILIGTTAFPVADIKHLEPGDVVLFEKSNSSEMTLLMPDREMKFKIKPNSRIVEPYDTVTGIGGVEDNSMNESNLWDSIQVDMSAEFDKVKVPLGELKSIEEGLIVDLCSVYDNKVSLKVSGKLVASGNLVIINDRFGVRIEQVSQSNPANSFNPQEADKGAETGNGEDFDYSDFEVEEKQG